jgi:hypothetical protein
MEKQKANLSKAFELNRCQEAVLHLSLNGNYCKQKVESKENSSNVNARQNENRSIYTRKQSQSLTISGLF